MYAYTVEPLYVQKAKDLIAADLYLPEKIKKPPVILMAHDLAALRQFKLIRYAQRFAQAGYAVILFDYRCWGGSTGKPRELFSIKNQLEDWYTVLAWVKQNKLFDSDHVVLWGTGLSGGYVLKLASEHKGLRAAMVQVPFVDGSETAKQYPIQHLAQALKLASQDLIAAKVGRVAKTLPVVHPYALSYYPAKDSYNGFMSIINSDYYWSGEIPARGLLELVRFRPIETLRKIMIPILYIAGINDRVVPIEISREAATNIAPYVDYHEWDINHFDIFQREWLNKAVETQLEFLSKYRGTLQP